MYRDFVLNLSVVTKCSLFLICEKDTAAEFELDLFQPKATTKVIGLTAITMVMVMVGREELEVNSVAVWLVCFVFLTFVLFITSSLSLYFMGCIFFARFQHDENI